MFRHIIEYKNYYYIRKLTISGWKYWDPFYNDWYSGKYIGAPSVADLETKWKLRNRKFVQWI